MNLPLITDPLSPPHVLVRGAEHALVLIEKGYKVTWLEATPEALKVARRALMPLPFTLQNRVEGIYLDDPTRFLPENFEAVIGW